MGEGQDKRPPERTPGAEDGTGSFLLGAGLGGLAVLHLVPLLALRVALVAGAVLVPVLAGVLAPVLILVLVILVAHLFHLVSYADSVRPEQGFMRSGKFFSERATLF